MESTTRQTAFSILYAAIHVFDVFQLTDACDCDEDSLSDYLNGRKPIPQSFKNALSKLMATKYHTLSGFNRNAR